MKIVLASASPRRSQILREAGFVFEVLKPDVDESFPDTLAPEKVPLFIAEKKLAAAKILADKNAVIITADTVVLLGDKIIGKPVDENDAISILSMLSGKVHKVISAVCISANNNIVRLEVTTHVHFNELTSDEIELYIKKYKPFDKAGAYAIQEWIGINKIKRIDGDYYNVVGFPMSSIYPVLINLMQENI